MFISNDILVQHTLNHHVYKDLKHGNLKNPYVYR